MECTNARHRKGFYGMGYLLGLFVAVRVQKKVGDSGPVRNENGVAATAGRGSFLQRFGKDED